MRGGRRASGPTRPAARPLSADRTALLIEACATGPARSHGDEHDTPPRLLGGDLLANAAELAQARSVVLLVGSLVRHEGKRAVGGPAGASLVPGSVDGPAGAVALARALVSGSVAESSGCSVVVVTDEANADVVMAGVAGCGVGGKQLRLEALAAANDWGLEDEERWVLTRTEQTRGTWRRLTSNPVQVGGHGEGGGSRRRYRPPFCGPTGGLL